MAAPKKPARKKPTPLLPLTSRLFSLTARENEMLAFLAQAMTDRIGRTISAGAVIRALIRCADKGQVRAEAIVEEIAAELQAGRLWGSKPR